MPKPVVVLVDDDELFRFVTRQMLVPLDIDIVEAVDGIEGLETIRRMCDERCPDLVLSDIRMPRMGGMELLNEIKSDAVTSRIPVILISSFNIDEIANEARQAGAVNLLTKPIEATALSEAVTSAL